jgi:hypothetical protein
MPMADDLGMSEQDRAAAAMREAGVTYQDMGHGFHVHKVGRYLTSGEILGSWSPRLGIR